eukprot:TRINITY_DN8109_c0_g1_i1.p1 TRINITY_DN8109_c0_g1~~TRINITY_DN8109_c0_g1_i1.p1  ORF type:complete len:865 (+),score=135.27 TRINITY_DN8109_c0_g1_i1:106-2700(+)
MYNELYPAPSVKWYPNAASLPRTNPSGFSYPEPVNNGNVYGGCAGGSAPGPSLGGFASAGGVAGRAGGGGGYGGTGYATGGSADGAVAAAPQMGSIAGLASTLYAGGSITPCETAEASFSTRCDFAGVGGGGAGGGGGSLTSLVGGGGGGGLPGKAGSIDMNGSMHNLNDYDRHARASPQNMSFYTRAAAVDLPRAYVGLGGRPGGGGTSSFDAAGAPTGQQCPGASGGGAGSSGHIVVNVDSALDLTPSDRFGVHHYCATASYPGESEEEERSRKSTAVRANPSSTDPTKENCVLHRRILVPYNSRQQLVMVSIYEVDQLGDTLVGKATVPLADPKLSSTTVWPLILDSQPNGTLTLNIQLPYGDALSNSITAIAQTATAKGRDALQGSAPSSPCNRGKPNSGSFGAAPQTPYGPAPPATGSFGPAPVAAAAHAAQAAAAQAQAQGQASSTAAAAERLSASTGGFGCSAGGCVPGFIGSIGAGGGAAADAGDGQRSHSYVPPPTDSLGLTLTGLPAGASSWTPLPGGPPSYVPPCLGMNIPPIPAQPMLGSGGPCGNVLGGMGSAGGMGGMGVGPPPGGACNTQLSAQTQQPQLPWLLGSCGLNPPGSGACGLQPPGSAPCGLQPPGSGACGLQPPGSAPCGLQPPGSGVCGLQPPGSGGCGLQPLCPGACGMQRPGSGCCGMQPSGGLQPHGSAACGLQPQGSLGSGFQSAGSVGVPRGTVTSTSFAGPGAVSNSLTSMVGGPSLVSPSIRTSGVSSRMSTNGAPQFQPMAAQSGLVRPSSMTSRQMGSSLSPSSGHVQRLQPQMQQQVLGAPGTARANCGAFPAPCGHSMFCNQGNPSAGVTGGSGFQAMPQQRQPFRTGF